jgi:hypothetical protein
MLSARGGGKRFTRSGGAFSPFGGVGWTEAAATVHPMMKRLSLIVAFAVVIAATFTASASAGGGFETITARYGKSPIVHYRIRYDVWPGRYACIEDEYGFYDDPGCYDYESGDATIDVRVFRTFAGGKRRLIHHETALGMNGRASIDLYSYLFPDLYRTTSLSYRIVFRLIDPVTDRVVDLVNRHFRVHYG